MEKNGEIKQRIFRVFWDKETDNPPYEEIVEVINEAGREFLSENSTDCDECWRAAIQDWFDKWFGFEVNK